MAADRRGLVAGASPTRLRRDDDRPITREAGVSRSAFYGQFESKEECFLATYDLAAEWVCGRVEAAAAEDEERGARARAGISEAMRLLAANPDLAHLIVVEALQAGSVARRRRQACVARLAEALRAARPDEGIDSPRIWRSFSSSARSR